MSDGLIDLAQNSCWVYLVLDLGSQINVHFPKEFSVMVCETHCSTFLHQPATGRAVPLSAGAGGGRAGVEAGFLQRGQCCKNDLAALLTICRVGPSSSGADQFSDIHLRY